MSPRYYCLSSDVIPTGIPATARFTPVAAPRRLLSVWLYAFAPPFWALCSNLFAGPASAAAIAVINSVGNLSGFAGPFVMGWLRDTTGSFAFSLLAIAAGPALAAIGLVLMKRRSLWDGC